MELGLMEIILTLFNSAIIGASFVLLLWLMRKLFKSL